MNAVNKIRGFLMKETPNASPDTRSTMEMKYFILGPSNQLYVTSNLALLQYLINSSTSITGLYDNCNRYLKQLIFDGKILVSDVKPHLQPEKLAFYNSKYFEATIHLKSSKSKINESTINTNKDTDVGKSHFFIFSFEDDSVLLLHSMMVSYHDLVTNDQKIKEFLSIKFNNLINEPETINSETLNYKKHLEQYKSKMKLIIKKMELDHKEMAEGIDMKAKTVVEEEIEDRKDNNSTQLVKLDNGSLYAGNLNDGKPTGNGKEFLEDGSSYVGEFKDGYWHGLGYIVDSENYICYAEFYKGRVVGI